MAEAPHVVVFDVNGTLSDMSPMGARWESVGASGHVAQQWFAEVLRDGFALAAAGAAAPFSAIAAATADRLLRATDATDGTSGSVLAAVAHIMAGFDELTVHPDVPDGLRALRAAGVRLITLSNGGAEVAHGLLERAGVRKECEALLSVQDAPRWKPAPEAYAHALQYAQVTVPADAMLVAVHPWDVDGAARAGLRTAWVNRSGGPYPDFFRPPEITVKSLTELADRWARD